MQDDIIKKLEKDFRASQKILNAIGDETRQHLLCMMIRSINHPRRVIELAEQTNLSRPAVSHHMQILKDAELVKTRKKARIYTIIWILRRAK